MMVVLFHSIHCYSVVYYCVRIQTVGETFGKATTIAPYKNSRFVNLASIDGNVPVNGLYCKYLLNTMGRKSKQPSVKRSEGEDDWSYNCESVVN
jgi:hypothetical protein